jgi:hypothetical protein
VESMHSAAMPLRLSASTWSFIRAMRGETTMVIPESLACRALVWRSTSGNAMAGICLYQYRRSADDVGTGELKRTW